MRTIANANKAAYLTALLAIPAVLLADALHKRWKARKGEGGRRPERA